VILLKILGGMYLAKVISKVFCKADVSPYGCEDHLLHLHGAVERDCCLTGICHFECKRGASRWRYRNLPLPDKAKPLEVRATFENMDTEAQRVGKSILHWSSEQP